MLAYPIEMGQSKQGVNLSRILVKTLIPGLSIPPQMLTTPNTGSILARVRLQSRLNTRSARLNGRRGVRWRGPGPLFPSASALVLRASLTYAWSP